MKLKPIVPIPNEIQSPLVNGKCRVRASRTGKLWTMIPEKPEYFWKWFDENGNLMGYLIRVLNNDGEKRVYILLYCESEKDVGWWQVGWKASFPDELKPLFNLHTITDKDSVLVVEGEKNAYLVAKELKDIGVVCNQGGSSHVNISNWKSLKDKVVYIMPDNDAAGAKAAKQIINHLVGLAKQIYLIEIPDDKPEKWDLADLIISDGKHGDEVNQFIEDHAKEVRLDHQSFYQGDLCKQAELISILRTKGIASNRNSKNDSRSVSFRKTNFLFLKINEGLVSAKTMREHEFVKKNASFIFSKKTKLNDQLKDFVIVFENPDPIENWEDYDAVVNYLHSKLVFSNRVSSQSKFSEKSGGDIWEFGNLLDSNFLKEAKIFHGKFRDFNQMILEINDDKYHIFDYTQTVRMISYIKKSFCDFNPQEKNHLYIAVSNFAKQFIDLFDIDSFKDQNLQDEYREWGLNFDELGVEHLYFKAKQCGYKICIKKRLERTSGQVALEDLFEYGMNYFSFLDKLYQFDDFAFKEISDSVLRKKISSFFNKYKVEDKTPYASDTHVEKALKFVKNICYKDIGNINLTGVNLKNGWLRVYYDKKHTQVKFGLFPTSPEYLFTYYSDFEFDQNIETNKIDEIIGEILPEPLLKILLRTIAATLDINTMRIKHGRNIKALFCRGSGSNGKDLIHKLTRRVFSQKSMSNVPLQAFKSNDKGGFGLSNLIGSKINWTSENQRISIDNCDALKACITGDPLEINIKYREALNYNFKGILLFNLNHAPVITTNQMAISSRYALITFPFEFVDKPILAHQKAVNSSLKEDDTVLEKLIPAFLNRLILEFISLFDEGIDYSPVSEAMNQLKCESSHLYDFVHCYQIKESSFDVSEVPLIDLHSMYIAYCYENDFIIEQTDDRPAIYNHPDSRFDRILLGKQQFMKALKQIFPNIHERNINGRKMLAITLK